VFRVVLAGPKRGQKIKNDPSPLLRDQEDCAWARDAGGRAQGDGALGGALCAAAGENGDESFAVAGERAALTAVLRFGAGPMLGYTSRPVGGRGPLLCGMGHMLCVRRDCVAERSDATWRL